MFIKAEPTRINLTLSGKIAISFLFYSYFCIISAYAANMESIDNSFREPPRIDLLSSAGDLTKVERARLMWNIDPVAVRLKAINHSTRLEVPVLNSFCFF